MFNTPRLQALEPKTEAVALPVEDFHPVAVVTQENKKHRVEHCDFDIQLNQSSQAVDGLSKAHGPRIEIHFRGVDQEHCADCNAVRPVDPVDGVSTFAVEHRRGAPVIREMATTEHLDATKNRENEGDR
ncbi:hypothetical protein D3C81_551010 [compost metagenome]